MDVNGKTCTPTGPVGVGPGGIVACAGGRAGQRCAGVSYARAEHLMCEMWRGDGASVRNRSESAATAALLVPAAW